MRHTLAFLFLFAATLAPVFGQIPPPSSRERILQRPSPLSTQQPKLIVGIVVDQMRYDYLYRYQSKYGAGGFKRLLREGFSCENTHFNYVPTYTGPGHAAIYTGTTPSVNGIIGNDWYDPEWGKNRYVTADERVRTVGAPGKTGQHSPAVMLSTTITDELRLATNFQSKVVGVCLKDRGSILPAGHFPDASYWFDDETGNWITSTYYPDSLGLPQWVQQFNSRRLAAKHLALDWTTLHPEGEYRESFMDWDKYEKRIKGNPDGKFPYRLSELQKTAGTGYGLIRYTPFGNTLTLDFAMAAIDNMGLGADEVPDFLCLSFSSTDYCAHQFGIHAVETQDTYLRLDAEIERLLKFLDEKFGRDNVLVFLTADHGGAETPMHLLSLKTPAGIFEETKLEDALAAQIKQATGRAGDYILEVNNQQIWLDRKALQRDGLKQADVETLIINHLRSLPGVYDAFTRAELMQLPAEYPFVAETRRGFHPRRSGDILYQLDPAWHADDRFFKTGGTTHGSPYAYDTHVPLLWHGWRVRRGETHAPVSITDIAPTLAAMLRIMEPNGTTGQVIQDLMR